MQGKDGCQKGNMCRKMLRWKRIQIVFCLVGCVLLHEIFWCVSACAQGQDGIAAGAGLTVQDTPGGTGQDGDVVAYGTGRTVQDGNAAAGSEGLTVQDTPDGTGQDDGTQDDGSKQGQGDTDDGMSQGVSDSGGSSSLAIDNKNVYEGMENSYSGGYVPKVEGKKAIVVLPLLAKEKLSGNRMTVSLRLGEGENLPFVYKNYEKAVRLGKHKTKKSGKSVECYLVAFNLELKSERYNGSYPVTLSITAEDKNGNEIYQDFTVYVTITDGKDPAADAGDGSGSGDETPQFAPKVLIQSYEFSSEEILCGERFTTRLTLYNTSGINMAKNMMITIQPGENIELLSKTDSDYVSQLGAGESCTIQFAFRVLATAPGGQYDIGVTLDYADSKGNPYTIQEAVKVSAQQKTVVEIAPVSVPKNIQVGETIELQTQVMNLGKGKLYNVRAMLEADGLTPTGMAFIGDVEAGTSMSGSMEVTVEGLSGESLYGESQGKIIFYYEDESGKEMTQEQEFTTAILSPLAGNEEETAEDDTGQWWVIMVLIAIFLVQAVIIFIMRKRGQQIGEEKLDEE